LDCKVDGCIKAVFSGGLCAKHYEEQRLLTLPPCKAEGCAKGSTRAGFCDQHYRAQLRKEAPLCSVEGCGRPAVARGLCDAHVRRVYHQGSLENDDRAKDRGLRHKHPLYESWKQFSRSNTICDEWREDFWAFVNTVGDRPSPSYILKRPDTSRGIGPDNWIWWDKVPCKDRAEYMRKWTARNPDKVKNSSLKKHYGITKDTYDAMLDEQGGVCALCGQPERARRKGTLVARDLAVDHDHTTGKVRGLLCTRCNFVIAAYEAFPNILNKAQSYLDHHNNSG
jgi:hypothetical protein